MSYKVKVGKIEKNISEKLKRSVDASIDNQLANKIVDQIKKRTRLGFGVGPGGKQEKLKALNPNYRNQRARQEDLSGNTTPAKSNLTRSGEMIDSTKGTVKNSTIFISVTGRRKDGSGLTNDQVREYTEEQGRRFLALTNAEKKALIREIKRRVLRNL